MICLSILRPLEKIIEWVLPYAQYQNQLVDQAALMLTLSGRVSETQQVLANQTSFRLRTPDLNIEVRLPEPSAALYHSAVHLTTILVCKYPKYLVVACRRGVCGQGDVCEDHLHESSALYSA